MSRYTLERTALSRTIAVASNRGFTLIELMIVVAIIGILAAIAYPSYTSQMKKGRRADAEAVMNEAAQYLQRYYAAHNKYTGANLQDAGLSTSPKSGNVTYYEISLSDATTDQNFVLTAEPVGPQADDACGTLTLEATGAKKQSAANMTVQQCWQ